MDDQKILAPIKMKSALPLAKNKTPPKGGILWAWRFSYRKSAKIPGAHKIGAAISSPRIAGQHFYGHELSVLKRCVPKTLAFAFGLRLRSKTRCFKTRVLGRGLPNGKPQERLRFRALRSKTLAFKKRIAIIFCDFKTSLGARACVQVLCVQKTRRFAFAFLSPLRT